MPESPIIIILKRASKYVCVRSTITSWRNWSI